MNSCNAVIILLVLFGFVFVLVAFNKPSEQYTLPGMSTGSTTTTTTTTKPRRTPVYTSLY